MADVFVVGAAATRFRPTGASTAQLAYEAAAGALADADLAAADIEAVFVGCRGTGSVPGGDALSVRLGLRRSGLRRDDASLAEHVSASGARAAHLAWRAVETGLYDVVLCVGAERVRIDAREDEDAELQRRAEAARRYMDASGATEAHLAMAAAKNRRHGARNPRACPAGEVPVEAVLDSDVVAWPLRRLMVAPRAAGAAAVIFAAPRAIRRTGGGSPRVRASVLVRSGRADPGGRAGDGVARAAGLAYRQSALGPEDIACAEVHDDTAAAELAAYEALQLVPEGQGPALLETGFTALGGVLPVNASGGLLSLGELDGASAIAQLHELTLQLRGCAGSRQVHGARAALAQSRGPGEDGAALVAVTVLADD